MTDWRARLASFRDNSADAAYGDSTESPSLPPAGAPIGTIGAIGIGQESAEAEAEPPSETARLMRRPSWSDAMAHPPPGAWCSCCGRTERKGGRWWQERTAPKGWRCCCCYPADHLKPEDVWELTT
jgi:hypothetical protein